jgi:hypothetical protein
MSDTILSKGNLSEEMVEFENLLNGELSLIKPEEIWEWELNRELLRLKLVALHLSAPSHQARVEEAPEEWVKFASLIIGQAA